MNTIYSNFDLEHQSEICVTKIIESTVKKIDVFTYHEGAAFYIYNNIRIYYSTYNDLKKYHSKPYYELITIDGTQVNIHLLDGTPKICGRNADEVYILEAEKSVPDDWSAIAVLFFPYGKTKANFLFSNNVDPKQYPGYKIIDSESKMIEHIRNPTTDEN